MNMNWLRFGQKKIKGIYQSKDKPAARQTLADLALPERVYIPLQHKQYALQSIVKVGDHVHQGTCVGHDAHNKTTGVFVHASISGTVVDIVSQPTMTHDQAKVPCVVIQNNHQNTCDFMEPLSIQNSSILDLKQRIMHAGIMGMGGAGFPVVQKIQTKNPLEHLIINGAECEPEMSCDDVMMRNYAKNIKQGAEIIMRILDIPHAIFVIEDNKKAASLMVQKAIQGDTRFSLKVIPTFYPGGGEKQLIENLFHQQLPKKSLPSDLGLMCFNVATLKAVSDAVLKGKPVTKRIVTFSGEGAVKPQNVWMPIGTPMQHAFNKLSVREGAYRVLCGGPMMGIDLGVLQKGFNEQLFILKTTNCILLLDDHRPNALECIRCGDCAQVCPMNLLPQQLYWFSKFDGFEHLESLGLFDCIECGACSYVCPSKISLVHYYRYAKESMIIDLKAKEKSDVARDRHAFRARRLEEQAREQKERMEARRAAIKQKKADKLLIENALKRVKD